MVTLCLRATPSILKKGKVIYPLPPSFPSFRNRLFRPSAALFFTSDTRGESGPVGSHRHVFIPYFDLPIPRFPARLIPVSPPFPSFPASISCLPKNSPKNLSVFPKTYLSSLKNGLFTGFPKTCPFPKNLMIFPKTSPDFTFWGVFKGRRGGLEGLLQQFPLCFPSSV